MVQARKQEFGILNFEDPSILKTHFNLNASNNLCITQNKLQHRFSKRAFWRRTTTERVYQTRQAAIYKFAIPLSETDLLKRFITFQVTAICKSETNPGIQLSNVISANGSYNNTTKQNIFYQASKQTNKHINSHSANPIK